MSSCKKYFKWFFSALMRGTKFSGHNILSLGWIGALGHPLYWFIWTYVFPQTYESFSFRWVSGLLCVPMIFHERIPDSLEKWKTLYLYAVTTIVVPGIFTFLVLMNDFSKVYITCEVMVICFILIFLRGLVAVMTSLVAGVLIGWLVYLCVSPPTHTLSNFSTAVEFLPLFGFAIFAGHLFYCSFTDSIKLNQMRIDAKKRENLIALAASIAHEMRTPLSQVKFGLDNIEHAIPNTSSTAKTQTLEIKDLNAIHTHIARSQLAIKRGDQIISMILNEVSDKPVNPSTFEYLDASQTTHKILDSYGFDTPGERDKVRIQTTRGFTFKVDETVYTFILYNLLKNALYYFKLKPEATVTITIANSTVVVRDTGPGIPPQVLSTLFDAFATSGKAEGTGLGLSYCRRAMRAFGGDIACNSVEGEFTEFTLRFPVVISGELAVHEGAVLHKAQAFFHGKRILVVDDQEGIRRATRHNLAGLDVHVDEAEDGAVAIEMLKKSKYDIVIMDLNMPVLDGYAAAEKIRQGVVPGQKNIPIVAHTAESSYIAHAKTQKVGMNGFVSKPCMRVELIKTLQETLEQAEKSAAIEAVATDHFAGKIIVVADDEKQNRDIVMSYLKPWGLTFIEAEHGMEVLELAMDGCRPSAILMDMEMPGMTGIQTTQFLRSHPGHRYIPVIALTGNSGESVRQKAREAGMNDFISKPLDIDELREKLAAVLMGGGAWPIVREQRPRALASKISAPVAVAGPPEPPPAPILWTEGALSARQVTTADGVPLLDIKRLDHEIERGHEFFMEYSTACSGIVVECLGLLPEQIASRKFEEFRDTLHKLLGNAGSMGAYALHQYLKFRVYPATGDALREWPTEANWLETCKDLYAKTDAALQVTYWAPSRVAQSP
jgi:two-component system CAI-1 autoinducer sensor kinase/phosphatase CqsS